MGDKTQVLEALLPALFYMTLKPTWLYESPWSSICQGKDPEFCGWCVLSDKVLGAKSRALARIRLAEDIGQHCRYAKPHNRKLPRLLEVVYPGKRQGKAQEVLNTMKPGSWRKERGRAWAEARWSESILR